MDVSIWELVSDATDALIPKRFSLLLLISHGAVFTSSSASPASSPPILMFKPPMTLDIAFPYWEPCILSPKSLNFLNVFKRLYTSLHPSFVML